MQLDNTLLLEKVAQARPSPSQGSTLFSIADQLIEDDFSMDLDDTLFTTLNQQGFAFPNPREMCEYLMSTE